MTRILRTSGQDEEEARVALTTVLGVSPEEISRSFAKNWSLETTLKDCLQTTEKNSKLSFQPERVQLTSCVAELASIYAESQTEKPSRRALEKWEASLDTLKSITPHIDVQDLDEQIEASVEHQLEKLEEATRRISVPTATPLTHESRDTQRDSQTLPRKPNHFLQRCSAQLQQQLEEVYHEMKEHESGEAALQTLISRAIPAAGFSRGVIYLLNQSQSKLVPAVTFGKDNILLDRASRNVIEASIDEAFQSEIPCHLQIS